MNYKEGTLDRVNVIHVGFIDPDPPTLQAVADAFDTHDNTFGKALRTTGTALNNITVTDVRSALQEQYTKPILPPRAGTNTSAALPGNVTSTVSWRGQFTGRKNRGRSYMVDTPSDSITAGETITGGRQSELASWAQGLMTAMAGLQSFVAIGSPAAHTATRVISFVIEAILDSQRRRLPGRGR